MADTKDYKATFELVDSDGDGLISADELKQVMLALGDDITDEQAREYVRKVDSDGDGRISLEEFASFLGAE